MVKRKTTEQFINDAIAVHGDKYDYSKTVYTRRCDPITVICAVHGEFYPIAGNHLQGSLCAQCQTNNRSKPIEVFIHQFKKIHGNRYDYSLVSKPFKNDKIDIVCSVHGVFQQRPHDHKIGIGCPSCSGLKRKTTDQFITDAIAVHGDRYDYSETDYKNNKTPIIIICSNHGKFKQRPLNHIKDYQGCPVCGKERVATMNTKNTDQFIKDAIAVHGDTYDYSKTLYVKALQKVTICCPKHGEFKQKPSEHLTGYGCWDCGVTKRAETKIKTTEQFIKDAIAVHGDMYDYSETEYTLSNELVNIICPVHGMFTITPTNHLSGRGCRKCQNRRKSKPSQEWLDSLDIPDDDQHREVKGILKPYVLDGYDPETNTVYEFHGDYWHGNPDIYEADEINPTNKISYGKLYEQTQMKKQALLVAGFNYIEMWESDWNKIS